MAKIKLIPEPEFKAKVPVPVPGKGLVEVEFTFRYRTREEMQRFIGKTMHGQPEYDDSIDDAQLVMMCATGWELADPFNAESVKEFASQYMAGPAAVYEAYLAEMSGARAKNFVRPRL